MHTYYDNQEPKKLDEREQPQAKRKARQRFEPEGVVYGLRPGAGVRVGDGDLGRRGADPALREAEQARRAPPPVHRAGARDVRWTQVFVRVDGDWRLAASQATGVSPTT